MKKLFVLIVVFFAFSAYGQKEGRTLIQGQISVDQKGDVGNINVFNMTSGDYTYTDDYGRFNIFVKVNDRLVFSSIQYQQFTVIITKKIVAEGKLNVSLTESQIELEEIVVKPDLSGDVAIDVKKLDAQKVNMPSADVQEIIHGYGYTFRDDSQSTVENPGMNKGFLQNGLNFANLFKALFRSDKRKKKNSSTGDVDVEVRKVYHDEFFQKYLDIDRDHINDFLFYVESHGLSKELMQNGHELELIQFLIAKSKDYKERQKAGQ